MQADSTFANRAAPLHSRHDFLADEAALLPADPAKKVEIDVRRKDLRFAIIAPEGGDSGADLRFRLRLVADHQAAGIRCRNNRTARETGRPGI
ncbi:MAG: hypothetical protein CMF74_08780 [Maricaulis sp.]|nr:hypothetical protein [Maricaulis sp.]